MIYIMKLFTIFGHRIVTSMSLNGQVRIIFLKIKKTNEILIQAINHLINALGRLPHTSGKRTKIFIQQCKFIILARFKSSKEKLEITLSKLDRIKRLFDAPNLFTAAMSSLASVFLFLLPRIIKSYQENSLDQWISRNMFRKEHLRNFFREILFMVTKLLISYLM